MEATSLTRRSESVRDGGRGRGTKGRGPDHRPFARIAPRAGEFCTRVYDRLFASTRSVRCSHGDGGRRHRKLSARLVAIVDSCRRRAADPAAGGLGRRHAAYGVRPRDFDAVGEARLRRGRRLR